MKRISFTCIACLLAGMFMGRWMTDENHLLDFGSGEAQAAPGDFWERQADDNPEMTSEERTNVLVYERSNPSVVNISTRSIQFDNFLWMQRAAEGSGSGTVLDKNGHILTNYHVVEDADTIEVTLASNEAYTATLVGKDKEHDIAILQIDAHIDWRICDSV